MNVNQAYPSKYLSADDLQGRQVTVQISNVTLEDIGQGNDKDRKLVLSFHGKSKQLVCNKTNSKTIAGLYGDETDNWIGKPIILMPREVEFQGSMVWAIRVSLQKPAQSQSAPSNPPAASADRSPPPSKPAPRNENLDEDVPF